MWYRAESGVRPREVDETISETSVFLRRNIREEQREAEGETVTVYTYEETKVPKEVYPIIAQQQADIDYLSMLVEE